MATNIDTALEPLDMASMTDAPAIESKLRTLMT